MFALLVRYGFYLTRIARVGDQFSNLTDGRPNLSWPRFFP